MEQDIQIKYIFVLKAVLIADEHLGALALREESFSGRLGLASQCRKKGEEGGGAKKVFIFEFSR